MPVRFRRSNIEFRGCKWQQVLNKLLNLKYQYNLQLISKTEHPCLNKSGGTDHVVRLHCVAEDDTDWKKAVKTHNDYIAVWQNSAITAGGHRSKQYMYSCYISMQGGHRHMTRGNCPVGRYLNSLSYVKLEIQCCFSWNVQASATISNPSNSYV